MDIRRICGIKPGKLQLPSQLQQKLDDILQRQIQYVAKWQTAYNYLRAGHHNLFLMLLCSLTQHEITKTKPW